MRFSMMTAGCAALALTACNPADKPAENGETAKAGAAKSEAMTAADLKPPKPGKWRMVSTMSEGPGAGMTMPAVEVCIDKADFSEIQKGSAPPEAQCDDMSVRRDGAAVVTHARCVADGVTTTIDNRMTGDMDSRYETDMTVTSTPGVGTMRMKVVAERLGDC